MPDLRDFSSIMTENVPLARLTTLKVGGPARYFFEPRTEDELRSLLAALAALSTPHKILGGGSNVLAPDAGFPGAVIRLAGDFATLSFDGPLATAGAAVPLPRFVRESAARGLSGAECLVGIPGTLGGALVMNAGGQWGRIGPLVESVRILDEHSAPRRLTAADITFSYRQSSLAGRTILSAGFRLSQSDPGTVKAAAEDFLRRKRATPDLSSPSAGCFFRNPPSGLPAGQLIDRAGLRGSRIGGAVVSSIHANYIVNSGSATAKDVLSLATLVKTQVRAKFGTDLEFEVELW